MGEEAAEEPSGGATDAATDRTTADDGATDGAMVDGADATGDALDPDAADGAVVDDGATDGATVDDGASDGATVDDGATDGATIDDGATDGASDGATVTDGATDGASDAGTDAATGDAASDAAADASDAGATDSGGATDGGYVWDGGAGCTLCHGSANPAPPRDTLGNTTTAAIGVGAHQSHLAPSSWHAQVGCSECHILPSKPVDPAVPTHLNSVDDVVWGPLARSGTFDPTTATCTGVYCHGAGLKPDDVGTPSNRTPLWTQVDGSQAACGTSCHTLPPGGNHPNSTACQACHNDVVDSISVGATVSVVWKNPALHINGTVDVLSSILQCTSCHGDPSSNNPAPPIGTAGETDPSTRAVGAHGSHLGPQGWHKPVACNACHTVPTSAPHANGTVDIKFGDTAIASNATPSYDGTALTCAGVYCHGSSLPADGSLRTPVWTTVDQTYDSCGSACHATPPGGSHPQNDACPTCHTATIASFTPGNPSQAVWANAALHIDGHVDVGTMGCTTCHGDAVRNDPAPPHGTNGETLTTQGAVGAHQAHLTPSGWHRDVQCTDCHTVPASVLHSDGLVDLKFSAVAAARGAAPSFDVASVSCASVYCHGTQLAGAKAGGSVARTPVWTKVDGTFKACGTSCHTNPPGGTHPQSTACAMCHRSVIATYDPLNPSAATWVNPDLHGDGKVDVAALTCTSCHGDSVRGDAAPPYGTKGEAATTTRAVGAHQSHLAASTWHRAGDCTDCHTVPASTLHTSGAVDIAFGTLASKGGTLPKFDTTALTCSGAYCHGATLLGAASGGTVMRTPLWTKVDDTQAACGSTCHTNPPGGAHPQNDACPTCHGAVVSAYAAGNPASVAWADPKRHIDGTVDVAQLTCTSCHGDSVTGSVAPPKGTQGETLTTQPAVGAHTSHLSQASWHRQVQCTDCHTVPASTSHSNSAVDFSWGGPSAADGAMPLFDPSTNTCTGAYCHGATLLGAVAGGTVMRTPRWTKVDDTQAACGTTCHTLPPGGTHPANDACPACHTPVIQSFTPGNPPTVVWKDASLHIDGKHDLATLTCTSCHGDAVANTPAPPRGTNGETLTNQAAVGAHTAHLSTSTWHRDGQCTDCHVVPASTAHSNGTLDLSWGGPSATGGAWPTFSPTALTCTGGYCHGATLRGANTGGTVSRTPLWTKVDGTYDSCGNTCHTNPPGGTHPAHTDCRICHAAVVATYDPATRATTWADRNKHIDGVVDSNKYHDLTGWTTPKGGANHHGSNYFVANQQRDEHNVACTQCHGAALDGGTVGVTCNNTSCHSNADWKSCGFCHGNRATQYNPPAGVGAETTTNTLAVGRHVAHLAASTTHVAFACSSCHTVPAAGDIAHALGYVPSADLTTTGHHGDVVFSGAGAVGMTFNVAGTTGNPATGRGTCTGACHSNGRGGAPVTTPYWAGGTWTVGSCGTCHAASPSTGRHSRHTGISGVTCTNTCHAAATAATHLNGVRDVITAPASGFSIGTPTGTCATKTCTGTCHSKSHNYCW